MLLSAAMVLLLGSVALAEGSSGFVGRAKIAIAAGDGIAAEAELRKAIDHGIPPRDIAAFAGEAELLQGNLAAAREWLGPAAFSEETRERGYRALARLEIAQGNTQAAVDVYDRALSSGVQSAELWVDIGRLRYRSGQHHQARDAAIRATHHNPRSIRALEFRGQFARDSKGPVPALKWFERGVELDPDDLQLLGEYAATLSEAGQNKKMLEVTRHMVELNPADPKAYWLQSILAARSGNIRLARKLLDRTNGAYSNTPAGQILASILELDGGSPEAATSLLDELVERQPDNKIARRLLGKALLDSGRPEEVIAKFRPTADRPDASPYELQLVGRAFEQLDRRVEASEYLDRANEPRGVAITVMPVWSEARSVESAQSLVPELRQLFASGRQGEAAAWVNRMAERYEGSIDVENLGADAALLSGRPRIALALYSSAAQIRMDFPLVERMVAAQRLAGLDKEAQATLAEFVASHPRSLPAIAMLGRIEAQAGNLERGMKLLAAASDMSGRREPALLADLAMLRKSAGLDGNQPMRRAH